MTLNSTLGHVDAESFVSISEVTTFFSAQSKKPQASAWSAASDANKEAACRLATSHISRVLETFMQRDQQRQALVMPSVHHRMYTGVLTDGTNATTLYCSALGASPYLVDYPDDWFNGGSLIVNESASKCAGQVRRIADYTAATGKIVLETALSEAPGNANFRLLWPLKRHDLQLFESICIQAGYVLSDDYHGTEQNQVLRGVETNSSRSGDTIAAKERGPEAGLCHEVWTVLKTRKPKSVRYERG